MSFSNIPPWLPRSHCTIKTSQLKQMLKVYMNVYDAPKRHMLRYCTNIIPPVPETVRNPTKGIRLSSQMLKISSAKVCFQTH